MSDSESSIKQWRQALLLVRKVFICLLVLAALILSDCSTADAKLQSNTSKDGLQYHISLESLRDLEFQTWQLVVYKKEVSGENLILRVVGFPGTLRLDHPTPLLVKAGRRVWELEDITLANPDLLNDPRAAAAEFDLLPFLVTLNKNRPLRLLLEGSFTELPVPPYLVSEWRSLIQKDFPNETT